MNWINIVISIFVILVGLEILFEGEFVTRGFHVTPEAGYLFILIGIGGIVFSLIKYFKSSKSNP